MANRNSAVGRALQTPVSFRRSRLSTLLFNGLERPRQRFEHGHALLEQDAIVLVHSTQPFDLGAVRSIGARASTASRRPGALKKSVLSIAARRSLRARVARFSCAGVVLERRAFPPRLDASRAASFASVR